MHALASRTLRIVTCGTARLAIRTNRIDHVSLSLAYLGTTMAYAEEYSENEPSRAEVDALPGATLVEFGNPWCGYCTRAQPLISEALKAYPGVRHFKISDASGRRLGRSFRVKLWPTLVFLKNGGEASRLVRPTDADAIREALAGIAS